VTLSLCYRLNPKAWIAIALFDYWFINCFIPEAEEVAMETTFG
jgi:hypothetical protein